MPKTTLTTESLQKIVFEAIIQYGDSFQFANITGAVENKLRKIEGAFNIPSNIAYTGGLDNGDIARIREVIWDLIIMRYLTPGDYHHDQWPHLTVTEKGKTFFIS